MWVRYACELMGEIKCARCFESRMERFQTRGGYDDDDSMVRIKLSVVDIWEYTSTLVTPL